MKGIILFEISTLKLKNSMVKIIEDAGHSYTAVLLKKGHDKCLVKVGTKITLNKMNVKIMEEL